MINRLSDWKKFVDTGDQDKLEASALKEKANKVANHEILVVSGEGWEQEWVYIAKYGSFYRVDGDALMYAPAMAATSLPDMDGDKVDETQVEFENIEEKDAKALRRLFGKNLS